MLQSPDQDMPGSRTVHVHSLNEIGATYICRVMIKCPESQIMTQTARQTVNAYTTINVQFRGFDHEITYCSVCTAAGRSISRRRS